MAKINIKLKDITSLKSKDRVRKIITQKLFPGIDVYSIFIDEITEEKLTKSVANLKSFSKTGYHTLFNHKIPGIGPGEVVLYYIVDSAVSSEANVPGIDILINNKKYEIKAGRVGGNAVMGTKKFISNIRIGEKINLTKLCSELYELCKNKDLDASSVTDINSIRKDKEFIRIEREYGRACAPYFNSHDVVFFNNNATNSNGDVVATGKISAKDIYIERLDTGSKKLSIKPLIKIK